MSQLLLRPSAASRWIACPASVRLSKDIPDTPSGDAAMAGTAIHALAETCYLLGDDPMHSIGKTIEGVVMARWHCEMAQQHLDHIHHIEANCRRGAVKVEEKVTYLDAPGVLLRGTADVVGVGSDTLYIADLKTGSGYVDEDSDQLKIYALGALLQQDDATRGEIAHVQLHIVQPRHGDVRVHTMTIDELLEWEVKVLVPAIHATTNPDSQPQPSEKACQYCPAKLTCPAQREALAVIEQQPNVTAMTKEQVQEVMVRLSDEQISDLLNRAPIVESFVDALRKHALERMKQGGILPGWQLAPKRAARKWKDEAAARDALVEAGIPVKNLLITEFISPAAVEKLLAKEQKGMLEDLTVKESSGVTIARDASLRQ
jgi:hypothetical protein